MLHHRHLVNMAESNMADVLKRFASRITTSSVKERKQILGDLIPCLERPDFPEPGIKGILRHLLLTLPRYADSKSRRAVEKVIETLTVHHLDTLCKHFCIVLEETADLQKKVSPCPFNSAVALNALGWSCVIIRNGFNNKESMQGSSFQKLVDIQCLLLYGAFAAEKRNISGASYNRLRRIWKEIPGSVKCYADSVASGAQNIYCFCMISCIMKYLTVTKNQDNIQKYRDVFVDLYIKHVLGSRTRPASHLMESCKELLKHVTHDKFKDTVLPAVEKVLLRNPEIILEGVCEMLAGVTIDLSQYGLDVGKHLATHCRSKEDSARDIAGRGCKYLAKQCSDTSAVEKLVQHFFAVFNGSEGKLTVAVQRLGVLSGVGNLSYSAMSAGSSSQNLSSAVAELFIPVLQQEVHEGTLIHVLSMLSMWCAKFHTQVPTSLIDWFKKGMGLKSSTSTVRNAYIQCMNATFHGDTLIQGLQVLPLLLQSLEKAYSQPTQVALVSEGLSAACLLTKLSLVDIEAEAMLGTFWNIILDQDKQLFTSEKFLSSASEDALKNAATLVEKLILSHPQRLVEKNSQPFYKALLYAMTHGSYPLRKHAQNSARKLVSALGGPKIAVALLKEYRQVLQRQKLHEVEESTMENGDINEISGYIRPRVLCETLLCLSLVPNASSNEAETIAMEIFKDAHHPCIVKYSADVWLKVVNKLGIDLSKFVTSNVDLFLSDITKAESVTKDMASALATLAKVAPDVILPNIVQHVTEVLKNPDLMTTTRREVAIMKCPPGQLYDKSVIESATLVDDKLSNIKRENKLYSYEEQMADIELKKELEKKKKAKSGKEEPKLTKKQQEAMKVQLESEAAIRGRMLQLDNVVANACILLKACVRGNPTATRLHLPAILKAIVTLTSSGVAAPRLIKVFVDIRQVGFRQQDQWLALLVAHCTLRLLEPECDLDPVWDDEPLTSQATRAVEWIHAVTVQDKQSRRSSKPSAFPAPTFAYCFYLLRACLEKGGHKVGSNEQVMLQCMAIISAHANLRESGKITGVDENGPELLPRVDMLRLLTNVIGTNTGHLQQVAVTSLIDTATCASGLEGCAAAEMPEVQVLLDALLSPGTAVRESSLQALEVMEMVLPTPDYDYENGQELMRRVWVAKFDTQDENRTIAKSLWELLGFELDSGVSTMIVDDVVHDEEVIRTAAAEALAESIVIHPDNIQIVLVQLLDLYEEKLYLPPPVLDKFGRVMTEAPVDMWPGRCGIALALTKLSPYLPPDEIETLFAFYVQKALGDRNEQVRKFMLTAAVAAIEEHGKANVTSLLPVFEDFLAEAPDTASFDPVRQSVVILMGSLAKHLEKDDPKVKPIVAKLIETLSTPSQPVQEAVANCLPPLVPAIKENAPDLVKDLICLLLESENYGERKGAAYGLAGLVKGLGILSLKQLDIMNTLEKAIQNKKNTKYREGALFVFEMLCLMLGRLFEPYVVHILPNLLLCFGDANPHVRQAADDTAKAVMSKLSAHGVKLVLPSLLKALEEESWRTKSGSVELLGAMAFCAPKQLSACLPSIVPKLTEVLSDSHYKVQKAGAQALKQIGSVIRNPEIQAIVPTLLEALQDPTKKTTKCLQKLLETKFVHFIDAPSLALIMPVVERAFMDRSTETRKMAAQIIGNMYSLTDQKDLAPYLPTLIPGLKQSLLDPVPEVRSVSARALGAMVKGMGESGFEELVPWLMKTLTSEASSVDRSGAAQGLSEVVRSLGLERLDKLMPDIIQTAERTDIAPHVRDGYIMMYIYLPSVFGEDFTQYVGPIIPSILKALADEAEYVRETALRAGQRIVNMYANTAIELLLPELERGLFDDNWRIRYSSVQLLGDLLYRVSGVSGKMTTEGADEDDNFGTENSQQAILRALGQETQNRVLAGLYMGRSDTALMVRQAALHVWKIIVSHTPKMLREILSTLFELLLGCLASTSYDKRQVAARTLGDVVKKLGEKVLPEIIPILERGLQSDDSDQRQGVCIGLSEIMSSTSKDHIVVFADSLIPTVCKALCDPLPEVREAAAKTFDNLHANIGSRALDDILPDLLDKLDDPKMSEFALDGLKQVMAVKSRVVLPYLVPQLTKPPVNTRALSFLSAVAGESLTKFLPKILPALMSALGRKMGTAEEKQELEHCQSVVLSVSDDLGVRTVMDELLSATNHKEPHFRCAAVIILRAYCEQTRGDYTEYVPRLIRELIHLFTDDCETVLVASWECLSAVTKKLDASELLSHISNVRQAVRFACSDFRGTELPGFCLLKKGITPILPIFREGILNGPPETKEAAALGLGEVIKRTSPEALKPSVVHITGPLIRILGDRFSFNVKVALLDTLGLLLGKCGVMLKPFLPQLQTTFIKALNDPNRAVRLKAASALSKLIVIHSRVDPLFTELHSGFKNADDTSVRDTTLQALRGCITGAGARMSEKIRREMTSSLEELLSAQEDTSRTTAAACLGALCKHLPEDDLSILLNIHLLDTTASQDWIARHGRSVALSVALKEAAERLSVPEWNNRVVSAVIANSLADRIPICLSGLRGVGYLIKHQVCSAQSVRPELPNTLIKSIKQDSNDIKQLTAQVVCYIAKSVQQPMDMTLIKAFVPLLVNGTKEKNTIVKSYSEFALVALLRLREDESTFQDCLASLESGMRDSLSEVYNKALRRLLQKPDTGEEDIDDTQLV